MREQLLNRDIIELLKLHKTKGKRLAVLRERLAKEKKEFDLQKTKIDNLTENHDRLKLTLETTTEKEKEVS